MDDFQFPSILLSHLLLLLLWHSLHSSLHSSVDWSVVFVIVANASSYLSHSTKISAEHISSGCVSHSIFMCIKLYLGFIYISPTYEHNFKLPHFFVYANIIFIVENIIYHLIHSYFSGRFSVFHLITGPITTIIPPSFDYQNWAGKKIYRKIKQRITLIKFVVDFLYNLE